MKNQEMTAMEQALEAVKAAEEAVAAEAASKQKGKKLAEEAKPNANLEAEVEPKTDEEPVAESESKTEDNSEEGSILGTLFETSRTLNFSSGANQLPATAILTQVSKEIMEKIMEVVNSDKSIANLVQASMLKHDHMDDLIQKVYPLDDVDTSFLDSVSKEDAEKMIRSQQSKRSRAKSALADSKHINDYKTMLTGAVAENLIRKAKGILKSAGGADFAVEGITPEKMKEYSEDPEKLKKAIRNVQSKISILTSKADYKEGKESAKLRYAALKQEEAELKKLRDMSNAAMTEEERAKIEATNRIVSQLADVNPYQMDLEELRAKFAEVVETLVSK